MDFNQPSTSGRYKNKDYALNQNLLTKISDKKHENLIKIDMNKVTHAMPPVRQWSRDLPHPNFLKDKNVVPLCSQDMKKQAQKSHILSNEHLPESRPVTSDKEYKRLLMYRYLPEVLLSTHQKGDTLPISKETSCYEEEVNRNIQGQNIQAARVNFSKLTPVRRHQNKHGGTTNHKNLNSPKHESFQEVHNQYVNRECEIPKNALHNDLDAGANRQFVKYCVPSTPLESSALHVRTSFQVKNTPYVMCKKSISIQTDKPVKKEYNAVISEVEQSLESKYAQVPPTLETERSFERSNARYKQVEYALQTIVKTKAPNEVEGTRRRQDRVFTNSDGQAKSRQLGQCEPSNFLAGGAESLHPNKSLNWKFVKNQPCRECKSQRDASLNEKGLHLIINPNIRKMLTVNKNKPTITKKSVAVQTDPLVKKGCNKIRTGMKKQLQSKCVNVSSHIQTEYSQDNTSFQPQKHANISPSTFIPDKHVKEMNSGSGNQKVCVSSGRAASQSLVEKEVVESTSVVGKTQAMLNSRCKCACFNDDLSWSDEDAENHEHKDTCGLCFNEDSVWNVNNEVTKSLEYSSSPCQLTGKCSRQGCNCYGWINESTDGKTEDSFRTQEFLESRYNRHVTKQEKPNKVWRNQDSPRSSVEIDCRAVRNGNETRKKKRQNRPSHKLPGDSHYPMECGLSNFSESIARPKPEADDQLCHPNESHFSRHNHSNLTQTPKHIPEVKSSTVKASKSCLKYSCVRKERAKKVHFSNVVISQTIPSREETSVALSKNDKSNDFWVCANNKQQINFIQSAFKEYKDAKSEVSKNTEHTPSPSSCQQPLQSKFRYSSGDMNLKQTSLVFDDTHNIDKLPGNVLVITSEEDSDSEQSCQLLTPRSPTEHVLPDTKPRCSTTQGAPLTTTFLNHLIDNQSDSDNSLLNLFQVSSLDVSKKITHLAYQGTDDRNNCYIDASWFNRKFYNATHDSSSLHCNVGSDPDNNEEEENISPEIKYSTEKTPRPQQHKTWSSVQPHCPTETTDKFSHVESKHKHFHRTSSSKLAIENTKSTSTGIKSSKQVKVIYEQELNICNQRNSTSNQLEGSQADKFSDKNSVHEIYKNDRWDIKAIKNKSSSSRKPNSNELKMTYVDHTRYELQTSSSTEWSTCTPSNTNDGISNTSMDIRSVRARYRDFHREPKEIARNSQAQ